MTITDPTAATTVEFTLNGSPVTVRADHPHLLAALREELDVTSPKDGCSPSGQCGCCTVLIDGKAVVSCQQPLAKVAGQTVATLEGVDAEERAALRRRLRRLRRPAVRLLHPGHRRAGQGPDRQEGRGPHARRHGPPPRRPPLPVHGLREGARRHRGGRGGQGAGADAPGGVGTSGIEVRGAELALGDRGYIDDLRVPGMLHAALRLTDHARADVRRIDIESARRAPGVVAVLTAADVPGELRVGLIHKDWPVLIPEGGRTSYAGDVLAVVVAETRQQARAAGRARRGRLRRAARRSPTPWPPSTIPRSRCGAPTRTCCRCRSTRRGDVDAALAASAHVGARGVRDPAHRARLPRAGGHARRARRGRRTCTCTRAARACGTTATTSPRVLGVDRPTGSPSSSSRTAAPSAARRTWPTRPRPRWRPGSCSGRSSACCPARRASLHPRQAPPDPHGVPGRLRRRRPAHRPSGCGPVGDSAPTPASG